MKIKRLWSLVSATFIFLPGLVAGQEETAARYYHYRSTEMSTTTTWKCLTPFEKFLRSKRTTIENVH